MNRIFEVHSPKLKSVLGRGGGAPPAVVDGRVVPVHPPYGGQAHR
jgi:hypothetical protein